MVGWVPSPLPHGVKTLPFYPMENTFLTPWRVPLNLLGKGQWYILPYYGTPYPMGVPVFHGVAFTSLWISRGNFITPWGYPLHHEGTHYHMECIPLPHQGFHISNSGKRYPLPHQKRIGGTPTTWGGVHPIPWWGYPTTWGGVHPTPWWGYPTTWGWGTPYSMVQVPVPIRWGNPKQWCEKGVPALLLTLP